MTPGFGHVIRRMVAQIKRLSGQFVGELDIIFYARQEFKETIISSLQSMHIIQYIKLVGMAMFINLQISFSRS